MKFVGQIPYPLANGVSLGNNEKNDTKYPEANDFDFKNNISYPLNMWMKCKDLTMNWLSVTLCTIYYVQSLMSWISFFYTSCNSPFCSIWGHYSYQIKDWRIPTNYCILTIISVLLLLFCPVLYEFILWISQFKIGLKLWIVNI